ncbi:MAG: phosphoribosyltransferase family protein, partial [Rhodocyclaceae bacterium]|nr:phosphoribosyltransferase family protein [Rhodocyclaceae bacterium]
AQAAQRHGWESGVCRKTRHGDRHVAIELPSLPIAGRSVVLMDDMASSGHTVAQAARQLKAAGAASVDVAVTHALFAAGAVQLIREAGAGQIWSTDCVPHASNAVSIVPAVAEVLRALQARTV